MTMHKFLGILFFYTLAFNGDSMSYTKEYGTIRRYINEKGSRYLGLNVTKSDWELLKLHLVNIPRSYVDRPLSMDDIYTIIHAFHEVFGIREINYELHMYGIPYEGVNEIFDNLDKFISIIGTSNGISSSMGRWLEDIPYNRQLIERKIGLLEMGV